MKTKITMMMVLGSLLLFGCATVSDTESSLSAVGFKLKLAETPEQLANLEKLPQHELTPQKRHGQLFWVYADADSKRLYVGTPDQYNLYQQQQNEEQIAAMDRNTAEANLMAAQVDAVDGYWGAWGPWY